MHCWNDRDHPRERSLSGTQCRGREDDLRRSPPSGPGFYGRARPRDGLHVYVSLQGEWHLPVSSYRRR